MNFPFTPSAVQMDPNQDPEQAMHSLAMAASGTLPPYFRLNYLPSISAFLISLSFFHLSDSVSSLRLSKPCRTPIQLTLLFSAYTFFFTLCTPPHLHSPFSGSQSTIHLPDHDAVDLAAKWSLLFITIPDPCLSNAHDLQTYNRSLINSSWQPLPKLRSVKKKNNFMVLCKSLDYPSGFSAQFAGMRLILINQR